MPSAALPPPSEDEIARRLRLGEDGRTEFKSVAQRRFRAQPHDLAKAVAAMANTEGGTIFLGVEDDGTPSGVGDPGQADDLMVQITQICTDRIAPPITCDVTKVEFRGKLLLIVEVPGFAPQRPYLANGKLYRRYGSRSDAATREDLLRLLQSADYHFDDQRVRGATRDDLDEEAIRGAIPDGAQLPGPRWQAHRRRDPLLCSESDGLAARRKDNCRLFSGN
jgi:ATP-dependent DNA helicase RecG